MATPKRASVLFLAVALAGCGGARAPVRHAGAERTGAATAASTPAATSSAPEARTAAARTPTAKNSAPKTSATTTPAKTSAARTSAASTRAATTSTATTSAGTGAAGTSSAASNSATGTAKTRTSTTGGSTSHASKTHTSTTGLATPHTSTAGTHTTGTDPPRTRAASGSAPYAKLTTAAFGSGLTRFVPAATWNGKTVAWVARTAGGIAMLCFSQRYLELHLHSGTVDAGSVGWHFGPSVAGSEARHLLAAFNGGFKLSTGAGGFESYGRVAVPLRHGAASIVTYADGNTDVGSWGSEVPAHGQAVVSVRQNLTLLINHGVAASNLGCLLCWGATLGGVSNPARGALGIAADGSLIWAAGEHATVSALTSALIGAHVERAVELDINPEWVAGYLYAHRGGLPTPVTVLHGQSGIPGAYLSPWSRDFFSVVTR